MKIKLHASILLFFLCADISFCAQKGTFEFINQKYGDIFYALSIYKGISIVADDTITGSTSFQYAGTDFEKAFESFLSVNRLYVSKNESVWTVSKIALNENSEDQGLSLDAFDVAPAQILERLSRFTGITILFDILPSSKISIHVSAVSAETIADLVMKPFNAYTVEKSANHILIKKNMETIPNLPNLTRINIQHINDTYSAEINQARTSEILAMICGKENREYSNFIKNDPVLSGIIVSGRNFKELMDIFADQANFEIVDKNGVLYFLPSAVTDNVKKIRDSGFSWKEYGTQSIRTKDAISLINARFPGMQCIHIANVNKILAQVTDATDIELRSYLEQIDGKDNTSLVRLKYISTADFLKSLPPSVRKEEIVDTGTGNSFFFSGTNEMQKQFFEELKEIDKPKERIRYDMLIVQYENSSSLTWSANTELRQLSPGDMTSVSGSFGNLLNLNFDVITLFGYQFSAKLNTALSEKNAYVFADTTLHGITGENIKFQNTSTYRYQDSNIDPETGKTLYTGITREIVSGVVLDINGWVSGAGMVTMNIHASVSKRGVDVSETSGNPPTTSEKSITTKLNTANGEPIILSGLTQNDSSIVEQRIPFISKIPILGLLFKDSSNTKEKTEMVIYIVPHITSDFDEKDTASSLTKTAFERLVLPYVGEEIK